MIPIIVMLCGAVVYLIVFFVYLRISSNYYLNKHQKEWDERKATLIDIIPDITQNELRDFYCDYLDEIKHYYPFF